MYSNDGGKTWIKSDIDLAKDYATSIGFEHPQGEYSIKGHMRIEWDYFPCEIMCRGQVIPFENTKQLKAAIEKIESCQCKYPTIRFDGDEEYCSICQKRA